MVAVESSADREAPPGSKRLQEGGGVGCPQATKHPELIQVP